MENVLSRNRALAVSVPSAYVAISASMLVLVVLLILHVLSPEFDPSWRMVSEYALGNNPGFVSLLFIFWGVGSLALAMALRNEITSRWGKIGLGFLVISGVGEFLAAYFDVTHSLHGLAAFLGAPTLPVAAMLISIHLGRTPAWAFARKRILLSANLTWISFVLFAIAMAVFVSTYVKAGGTMTGTPVSTLPDGVIAFNGWTNRLWLILYNVWIIVTGTSLLQKFQFKPSS